MIRRTGQGGSSSARMALWLGRLFGQSGSPSARDAAARMVSSRRRLTLEEQPAAIYAIGDVHGCLDKLLHLEKLVQEDARAVDGRKLIVMLGDYIDRGPASAQVLDHLIAPAPDGFDRLSLCGNHEAVFLDLLDKPEELNAWLAFGGEQTIFSYGIDIGYLQSTMRLSAARIVDEIFQAVPQTHTDFLRALPVSIATPGFLFAHAGARPGISLDTQTDQDLMWIRRDFLDHDGPPFAKTIVHGHTPAPEPFLSQYRIGVDTGAYAGGPLTAVRIDALSIAVLDTISGNRAR